MLNIAKLPLTEQKRFCAEYVELFKKLKKDYKPPIPPYIRIVKFFWPIARRVLRLPDKPEDWVKAFENKDAKLKEQLKNAREDAEKKLLLYLIEMGECAIEATKLRQQIEENNLKLRRLNIIDNKYNPNLIKSHMFLINELYGLQRNYHRILLKKVKAQEGVIEILDKADTLSDNSKLLLIATLTDIFQSYLKAPNTTIAAAVITFEMLSKKLQKEGLQNKQLLESVSYHTKYFSTLQIEMDALFNSYKEKQMPVL